MIPEVLRKKTQRTAAWSSHARRDRLLPKIKMPLDTVMLLPLLRNSVNCLRLKPEALAIDWQRLLAAFRSTVHGVESKRA